MSKFGVENLPVIQILTVAPGAQGRPFQANQLHKIEQLRIAGYRNKIYLDGSVNNSTLPLIMAQKFRPDVLCVGSFFSAADNVEERIEFFNKTLRENQTD